VKVVSRTSTDKIHTDMFKVSLGYLPTSSETFVSVYELRTRHQKQARNKMAGYRPRDDRQGIGYAATFVVIKMILIK
jgi:hypothetical protein